MRAPLRAVGFAALVALAALAGGCDDQGEVWDREVGALTAHGLKGSAAIVDASAERGMMLPVVDEELEIDPIAIPIGRQFAASATTPDGDRLLVLSRGDTPRRRADDQPPSLVVVDGSSRPQALARYELSDPLSGLAVDPLGKLAVVHASEADAAFVQNPNELMVVDLARGAAADNPTPITLRSFGGRPEALTFTGELDLPGGKTRLLVVQTDRDVALLDLGDLTQPDITVRLTSSGERLEPAGLAITDGDPDRDDDACLAIRIAGDSSVMVLDMLPSDDADAPHPFRPIPNLVFVGGTPSDLAFAKTDGGRRLLALVPSRQVLTLVDPETGVASEIALGAPFERLSIVTDVVGGTESGADVALLWSGSSPEVAFVALGSTVGKPYKSIERLELAEPVAEVLDVPAPNAHLKVLASPDGRSFVVLDLLARTAAPIQASAFGTRVAPSPDGARAWMLAPGATSIAALDLATLHPKNIAMSHAVAGVFDVQRRDGGRALVALHAVGAGALTLLDARDPELATAREYAAVLLGDLP